AVTDDLKHHIVERKPEVIVFGHTHKAFHETLGGILYFNPGYAGRQRFELERSVAILHCGPRGIRHEFKPL
ncbi:MAG: metallophosphoesterase family protein, partial [Verrucomicrobia bacterium]|nr:metallophosphoesterase family protein [Verrucomicrobiota bacterium]